MFRVNGSNVLYKVWGIITLILGILTTLAGAGVLVIYYCFSDTTIGKLIYDIVANFGFEPMLLVLLFFLIILLIAVIQISTGNILIKETFKNKSEFSSRQFLYVLAIVGWVVTLILILKVNSLLVSLFGGLINLDKIQMTSIIKIIYDVITVIMLGSKSSNLIYYENIDEYSASSAGYYEQQPQEVFDNGYDQPIQEFPENQYNQPEQNMYQPEPVMPAANMDAINTATSNTTHSGAIMGLFGEYKDNKFTMEAGATCLIGRDKKCQIQLNHSKVSRVHCTIHRMENGDYQVIDSSTNGTFYENLRLPKGESYEVPKGALLAIGDADNVLQLL